MAYQNILVAVDDSPIAYAAVEHAFDLAQLNHSKVTLISVLALDPFVGIDFYKVAPAVTDYFMQAEADAKARLEELKQSQRAAGLDVEIKLIHSVPTPDGILDTAENIKADLIIMGSHGRKGVKKFMLGSVAQEVLSHAHIPVLIVKQ